MTHVVLHASAYDAVPSGARNRAAGIAAALLRRGVRVTVQSPAGLRFRPLVEEELGARAPDALWAEVPTRLDPSRPGARWLDAPFVADRALPADADLFVTDYHPVVARVPTALTVHDLRFMVAHRDEGRLRAAVFRHTFPRLAGRASLIVVPSEAVAGDVRRILGTPPGRVVVSPNAPGRAWGEAAPAEGPGRHLVVVGIGEPRKRLAMLVEALRRARGKGTVLPVFAVGVRTPLVRRVEREAADLRECGALRFVGCAADADVVALVATAAALLHPSRYEGFGLSVLEAFSCGVPVVATRTPAVEEVAGGLATLVDDDADAWAAALVAASAPRGPDRAAGAAREARAAEFTWDRAAAALLDGFARLGG